MKEKLKFMIAPILQIVSLISITIYAFVMLTRGQEVILKVTPSELNKKNVATPGQYLILDFDINKIVLNNITTDFDYTLGDLKVKDELYITLDEDINTGVWFPVAVTKQIPVIEDGKVFVSAKFLYMDNIEEKYEIFLTYDFKQFFIPANSNVKIDLDAEDIDLRVKLRIKQDGEVKILRLLNGDKIIV